MCFYGVKFNGCIALPCTLKIIKESLISIMFRVSFFFSFLTIRNILEGNMDIYEYLYFLVGKKKKDSRPGITGLKPCSFLFFIYLIYLFIHF